MGAAPVILGALRQRGAAASSARRSVHARRGVGVGAVSFTFDGFPLSAAHVGAQVLEDAGVRGTFYTSPGRWGHTTEDGALAGSAEVDALYSRGHEIGCLSFSGLPLVDVDADRLRSEVARSALAFQDGGVDRRFSSFAYPDGAADRGLRRAMGRCYSSCRSQSPGINGPRVDLSYLRSVALAGSDPGRDDNDGLLDDTRRDGAWLIFRTSGVSATPASSGCSGEVLAHAVDRALTLGLEVLPVKHALARVAFR